MNKKNDKLQALCRCYLKKLRYVAKKHGLGKFVDETIKANLRKECVGTQKEVEMLARLCDEERVSRSDIPSMLGKSYRNCCDDGDFDRIKKLKHTGIYSKVSVLMNKAD